MTTVQDLEWANKTYPNDKAYKILAGGNLSLPQFVSGNRANMFCSHLEQYVPLINPKSPNMPTSFEKPYGKYTDSYKVSDADYIVVAKIPKFMGVASKFNYTYVLQNIITKVYDVVEMRHYEVLSEDRGYLRPYTQADEYKTGDVIKKGTTLFRSNSHDEYGNYRYGRNPKVAMISIPETEEDGIVIRDGYREAFAFYDFVRVPIALNKNQILLNLYGDDNEYKCFPDLGEEIKDGILCAKRDINYQNAAAELTDHALKNIVNSDDVYKGEGYVADVDVWVNDEDEFIDSGNKSQIYKYYVAQKEYYTKLYNVLMPIVNAKKNDNVQYTKMLGWTFEHARNYLDKSIQWTDNNNSFEFAHVVVTMYAKKLPTNGHKLTDRFGGKGVISHVWPDEYMPRDEFGNVADIIISPASAIGRANPGQLYELEYNFIADEIAKRIEKLGSLREKEALLIDFITTCNPKEGASLKEFLQKKNDAAKQKFFEDIYENGIYLIEEPFGGTISLDNLELLYTKYKVKPGKVIITREFRNTATALPLDNFSELTPIKGESGFEYVDPSSGGNKKQFFKTNANGVSPFDIKKGEKFVTTKNGITKIGDKYYSERTDPKDKQRETRAYINSEGLLVRSFKSLNDVIIGRKYYILLKQMPDEKFSARSMGSTNQTGVPNKIGKQNKLTSPYSTSAMRSGEMETDNLFVRIDPEIIHRYMAEQSTNPEMREALAKMLLTEDPYKLHDLPIKSEDIMDDVPAIELASLLWSIGISINPIYGEVEE